MDRLIFLEYLWTAYLIMSTHVGDNQKRAQTSLRSGVVLIMGSGVNSGEVRESTVLDAVQKYGNRQKRR